MPNNQHVPDNFGTNYGITYTGNVVTYMQRVRNANADNRAFNQTKNMMEKRAISGGEKVNTSLNAFGFVSGIKETIIEGGAAFNRRLNISKVNDVSLIRTYGNSGAKYLKISKGLGVTGSILTTGYSILKVYDQFNTPGGLNYVLSNRDILDASVGMAGISAFFFLSNPVGWTIGAGVFVYGSATLIYDEIKKQK